MHPRDLWNYSRFLLSITPKSKNIMIYLLVVLSRNGERCGMTLLQMTSVLVRKTAELKESQKDVAHRELKDSLSEQKGGCEGLKEQQKEGRGGG